MTVENKPSGDAIPDKNPNSSQVPDISPAQSGSMDPRNLITGNERLERSSDQKPRTFSDTDLGVGTDDGEGDKPTPKKAPAKEDDDDEFDDEDLEDDLDGVDEDDDLEDTEEELDDEEDEESEDEEDDTEEAEESTESQAGDAYDTKKIKVKVNGKWREYTGKQMKEFVASGAHLQEQREAFNTEAGRVKSEQDTREAKLREADNLLTPIYQAVKDKNPEQAVIESFKLTGMNKVQAKWKLIDQMAPVIASILGIEPEKFKARIDERMPIIKQMQMKDENEFYKEQSTKKAEEGDDKTLDKQADKEIDKFMDEHDISRPQLRNAVSWLKENTYKGKEDQINFPVIAKFIGAKRAIDKAITAIGAVRPSLSGDTKFVDRVINLAKKKPDWTADKLARWVEKKARGLKKAKTDDEVGELRKDVSRKVLKANNQSVLKKSAPSSQKKPRMFSDFNGDGGADLDI